MQTPIDDLLRRAVEANASDLHLKVGSPPVIRIDGELMRLADLPGLRPADTEGYAQAIFTQKASADFRQNNEADFAYGRQDLGRFRVSVFRQRGSVSLVMRRVVPGVPSMERLGVPPVVKRLAAEPRGLVLFTGPAGSGRTTTIAAFIEHINATRPVSVVTVEDPIEVLFPDRLAVISQREVGVDTADYAEGVRRAIRQDADVIMISEIADGPTAAAAIAAAETGHLVAGVMHTADPMDSINRFVELFPPSQQRTARSQLAGLLRGVVSHRLIDSTDGSGLVLATEILTSNERVRERILGDAAVEDYVEVMKDAEFFGMRTFDQSLLELVKARKVAVAAALGHVRNPHEFRAKALEAGVEV
ncbi:MAG: PilT/PilU family type 4a pilus ATPase [Acidimicrobiia bacterium]|jgi:twitching motility protein PilT